MSSPLLYILAPFAFAFALFAVFLIVSILLKDPARPFRMFGAPPLEDSSEFRDHPSIPPERDSGQGSSEEDEEEIKEK